MIARHLISLAALLAALERMPSGRAVRWSLDVDPIDLF